MVSNRAKLLNSTKQFAVLDAEGNTSGSFNRGGKTDLSSLKILFETHPKLRKPGFYEVKGSFV